MFRPGMNPLPLPLPQGAGSRVENYSSPSTGEAGVTLSLSKGRGWFLYYQSISHVDRPVAQLGYLGVVGHDNEGRAGGTVDLLDHFDDFV